jgi:hypothetical protein
VGRLKYRKADGAPVQADPEDFENPPETPADHVRKARAQCSEDPPTGTDSISTDARITASIANLGSQYC